MVSTSWWLPRTKIIGGIFRLSASNQLMYLRALIVFPSTLLPAAFPVLFAGAAGAGKSMNTRLDSFDQCRTWRVRGGVCVCVCVGGCVWCGWRGGGAGEKEIRQCKWKGGGEETGDSAHESAARTGGDVGMGNNSSEEIGMAVWRSYGVRLLLRVLHGTRMSAYCMLRLNLMLTSSARRRI